MNKYTDKLFLFLAVCLMLSGCSGKSNQTTPKSSSAIRVVSLAPSITEIVYAIAGPEILVGRTSACDYPPEGIKDIPIIGGFGTPSLEALLKMEPTIILATDLADHTIVKQMEALGLHYKRINCRKLDDIPFAIELIGRYTGYEPQAGSLAQEIRSEIAKRVELKKRSEVYDKWMDSVRAKAVIRKY